ncbi:MAG: DMT family transporter [Pseudomonadota bacterium]
MSWMILAAIPPFLWSFSNVIDEYLSKNHFTQSPFLMIVAASVVQMLPAIGVLYFHQVAFDLPIMTIIFLNVLGVFTILCFAPYIKALQIDGAGVAVPLYQVIPVFTFIMAWMFLGEVVKLPQVFAAFLIVSAAFAITWDFSKKSISYKTLLLMFSSSLGLAIYNVIARYYLADIDWQAVLAWNLFGTGIFGLGAAIFHKKWRQGLIDTLTKGGKHVAVLFNVQALLDLFAFGFFVVALSMAPAAGLVSTMNGLQPFAVLIVSDLAAMILPQYFQKAASGKTLIWRILCIIALFIGVAVLSLSE